MSNDLEGAKQSAGRSLELYRALDDRWGMAKAQTVLGGALFVRGEYREARRWLEGSLSLLRALGDRRERVWPYHWLTWTLDGLGQFEEAERVAQEGVAVAQQVGDRGLVAWANGCLCDALRASGRFAETRPLLEAYLAYGRETGVKGIESWGWWTLGLNTTHLGAYEEARAAVQKALTLSQAAGQRGRVAINHMELGRLAVAERQYGAAQEWLQRSYAFYRQVAEQYWIIGEVFAALALADWGLGQMDRAGQHINRALRVVAKTHGHPVALYSLPAAALLLMDGRERSPTAVERAVELYALASRYGFVANSRWFEDVAGREISAAAEALPPDAVAAAKERGRARDLWATVEELLAELEA
jgi:tetratricopeptide (TPR) repeat protein